MRSLIATALSLALSVAASSALTAPSHASDGAAPAPRLTLVTLEGAGTAGTTGGAGSPTDRAALLAEQDAVLATIDAPEPTYRWTAALNGFAVALTPDQAAEVASLPAVALVEENEIRPLAAAPDPATRSVVSSPRLRGGAGVVVGVVDTGIAPESPAFSDVPGLGRAPRGFAGTCEAGEGWAPETCGRKILGARWFVAGFGADRVRASESMSAHDTLGHGTQVASVAAGNAGVTVRIEGRDAGRFGGVAPQARLAVYKACWAAPDPTDDGCSSADLVTAVDRAVADGVDVLNLSVAGGSGFDTLQWATLGAAEDDIVVVGAAGNSSRLDYAAHPAPWITTVGATVGHLPRAVVRAGPLRLPGTGRPGQVRGRLVLARDARVRGVPARQARQCRPGSLDARAVAGRIVVCERGGIGRIDKSRAVSQSDGIGMVLVNTAPGSTTADYHSVPTVHVGRAQGRALIRWMRHRKRPTATLRRDDIGDVQRRTARWSATGDPRSPVLKPDVVAEGDGVLGALPDSTGRSWGQITGSSVAAARASGLAALLRARHGWSASTVRSVLVTTANPLAGASVLQQGAGALGKDVPNTHLAITVPDQRWRRALNRRTLPRLNLTSAVLPTDKRAFTRRVTNIGAQAEYFSVEAQGFSNHQVRVRPLAVRLAPGQSATFRIRVAGSRTPGRLADGWIVWRGARGGETRIPVALTR